MTTPDERATARSQTLFASSSIFRPALQFKARASSVDAEPPVAVLASIDASDRNAWDPAPKDESTEVVRVTRFGRVTLRSVAPEAPALDPATFDQVVVRGRAEGAGELRLGFLLGEQLVGSSEVSEFAETASAQDIAFHVPAELQRTGAFDRVGLEVRRQGVLEVEAVDFVAHSALALLPSSDAGPQLASIGMDARRAIGLSPAREVSFEFRVLDGDRLHFSHGVPRELAAGAPVRLVVELHGDDVQRTESFDSSAVWLDERIDLDEYVGGKLQVRFLVTGGYHRNVGCLVTQPVLLRDTLGPPSVLLVTSDTHRGDHLGSAGALEIATPALDALASEGVSFSNCFSPSNYTNPSHVALMTATHPRDTGVVGNEQRLNDAPTTLAERFRAEGYETWAVVSARHLFDDISGLGQGFDRMAGPSGAERPAEEAIALLQRWLERRDGRPVFVWLHLFDPHWPYDPPQPFAGMANTPAAGDGRRAESRGDFGDTDAHIAAYRGEISYLDQQLGPLFEREPFRGGVVAFVGDHGESLGEHDTWFSHSGLFPSVLHVPLLLRYPGAPAGTRVTTRVAPLDLGATLLGLAETRAAGFPGASLLRFVDGAPAEPIYALHGRAAAASLTTPQGEHLIVTLGLHSGTGHYVEQEEGTLLFDLETDPGCVTELSAKNPERTAELRAQLGAWLAQGGPSDWLDGGGPKHARLQSLLKTLGYAEGGDGGAAPGTESSPNGGARKEH